MTTVLKRKALIVEDEPALADAIRYGLEREGFECSVASEGTTALSRFRDEHPDIVVLDLMLPGVSGEDICRAIRGDGDTPVIIVSAKGTELDRVVGLELGADDYLTKPFSVRELVARVRTVLRRTAAGDNGHAPLTVGPITLDPDRHTVEIRGASATLPLKEFLLLETFLRRAGKLCTRDFLIGEVWGPGYFGDTRTLDVHVKRLRAKVEEDPRRPRHLRTVRGLGYRFEP